MLYFQRGPYSYSIKCYNCVHAIILLPCNLKLYQSGMDKTAVRLQGAAVAESETDLSHSRLNLFFIKSKHAFRQFKNHDYFQNRHGSSYLRTTLKHSEFVESPAPYGVNNAYSYICGEVSKKRLREDPQRKRNKTDANLLQGGGRIKAFSIGADQKRRTHFVLPDLGSGVGKKLDYRSAQATIQDLPVQLEPFPLRGDNFSIRVDHLPARERERAALKSQEMIQLLYIDGSVDPSKWGGCQLKINIYNHIVSTFMKSRINYGEMTEQQFGVLRGLIVGIMGTEREYVEYKDMVNMRSMREVFAVLEGQGQVSYKREMVRYFFIANKLAYQYQLNRLKDEMKTMLSYQFGRDIGSHQLYIFDAGTGTEVTNLHELLQYNGRFIFGTEKRVSGVYLGWVREREAQEKLVSQIKRWKSIAPEEESSRTDSFKRMPAEQYRRLFDSVQRKRQRFLRGKKKPIVSLKGSQFIDRSKLTREDDIFQ